MKRQKSKAGVLIWMALIGTACAVLAVVLSKVIEKESIGMDGDLALLTYNVDEMSKNPLLIDPEVDIEMIENLDFFAEISK